MCFKNPEDPTCIGLLFIDKQATKIKKMEVGVMKMPFSKMKPQAN